MDSAEKYPSGLHLQRLYNQLLLHSKYNLWSNSTFGRNKKTMAECLRFICRACGKTVKSWSDGNPYYIDASMGKQYAYHPDHERLAMCTGNDTPHFCLTCGNEFLVDSCAPVEHCPKCSSLDIANTFQLSGRHCPACPAGYFEIDPDFGCIS